MSETPNRAAADLLPPDLVPGAVREEILASPLPSLLLSHSGRSVLFASHAFARRLGAAEGAALMRTGLPRLAPGTARLEALAQEARPDDTPAPRRLERLRFVIAHSPVILNALVSTLSLADGTPALLVSLIEAHPVLPVEALPRWAEAAPTAPVEAAPAPVAPVAEAAPPIPAVTAHRPPAPTISLPRPARFVFSLSPEGDIESLSDAFGAALGVAPDAFTGQSMASVAGALDRNAGEAIEKAIAAGATWGGIRLNWPLPTEGRAVPVVLSAMPLHGEAGLTGFSGFGRCLFDDAVPLGAKPAPVVPAPLPPVQAEVPPSHDLEKAISAFAEDDAEAMEDVGPVMAPSVVVPEAVPPQLQELTAAPVADVPAADLPATDLPVPVLPVVPPAATEPAAPATVTPVEAAAPATVPVEAPAPASESANVVSIRPGQIDLPSGLPPHLSRPGLSMNERNAFREIARALGAKFDPDAYGTDEDLAAPPAPTPPEPLAPLGPEQGHAQDQENAQGTTQDNALGQAAGLDSPAAQGDLLAQLTPPPADVAAPAPTPAPDTFLVDHLPIGVLVLRDEATIFVNRTLLDLVGFDDLDDLNAQGGAQTLFRKGAMPREREDGFDTVVLATREGELIPVDAHLQPVEWNGAPASLISMRRAVELEQGKALTSVAQDLKRSRSENGELRAILDTATDGVITIDESGAILSLNGAAEALFGLSQNEVTGQSFTQLLLNESHAEALDYFEGLKINGMKSVLNDGREVSGREKKGGRIPLFLTFGRISDEEPKRYCAVLRDLTTWKRAEGELTEARRAAESASAKKSDFLAKVGHEIRTPMNAIIGFAEVMQEERLGPVNNPKYKEYLGDIRNSGLHVVSLVNDLLDLSKIEAGRMELNFAATDLNAIVSGCVGMIQPQATQMRVLVRSQLAAKLPLVVADERSIRQIVLNLLSNATRFTPSGGQVLVATALQENGEAVIRIRDTGVGMSAAEIEQALESYRQVGPRRDHGGTGLGLPLSKALAEANRAAFSIRSNPGEGTTVEISFPPTRVLAE